MTKAIPIVQKFMTYIPESIALDASLAEAEALMQKKDIRHLPVMEGEAVYGVLSDRDIKYALGLVEADPKTLKVHDVCHTHVYKTLPDAHINEVCDEMAEHHYGCAVVLQNEKLVGIFTTMDALRAFSKIVVQRFH